MAFPPVAVVIPRTHVCVASRADESRLITQSVSLWDGSLVTRPLARSPGDGGLVGAQPVCLHPVSTQPLSCHSAPTVMSKGIIDCGGFSPQLPPSLRKHTHTLCCASKLRFHVPIGKIAISFFFLGITELQKNILRSSRWFIGAPVDPTDHDTVL